MPDLREISLTLVGSATIDGKGVAKQTIFTVPTGKIFIPFAVEITNPSATLAGLVDMDVGAGANADDWLLEVTLNAFTAVTDYGILMQPVQAAGPPIVPAKKTHNVAGDVFGVLINTVSTGAATFTASLFGFLIDA